MTYSLSNNCTKNYYNRTLTVQVIVEDVVTWIFLKHSVYVHIDIQSIWAYFSFFSTDCTTLNKKLGCHWWTARRVCAIYAMAQLTPKTLPSSYVLPRGIWSFQVKRCEHKYREYQKIGSAGHRPVRMGRGWTLETPRPTCVIMLNLIAVRQTVRACYVWRSAGNELPTSRL